MSRPVHVFDGLPLLSLLVFGACDAASARADAGGEDCAGVLHIGDRRQVFIDKALLARSSGVKLHVHRPRKTGERTIVISNDDITFLNNDPLFIQPVITLQGSDGLPVRLTKDDYFAISGYIEVEYHMDGEF